MNLRLTILAILVTLAASFGLYQTELRVRHEERVLADLNHQLVRDQQAIRVLRAEWAYLNEPQRLQALAERYLPLRSTRDSQVAQMAELSARLPAVVDEPGGGLPPAADVPLPRAKPKRPGGVLLASGGFDD